MRDRWRRITDAQASLKLLALGLVGTLVACQPSAPEDEDAQQASQAEASEETSKSPKLPKLPRPKACKAFAPDAAFPDTNPNSKTYQEKLSPEDYLGEVSLWIPTFDCDC